VKIVHAADLHLDSPLSGLERYPGAPVEAIRGASRRALANLVALCLEERAELLLIAGDVYDGDWRDYSTGMFFVSELLRLRDAGTRVVLVRGNHDAASQITRHLDLPAHVTELASARPVTLRLEDLGVAVHGQSFRDRSVQDDLASRYPDPVAGVLNVGLLHTSLTGREGHHDYAPCTMETLRSRGYDYWALGHVHQREVVSEAPWVVFPGNLQGRHARETGPKGATVLTVNDSRIASVEHRALDVVRWAVCDVDAAGAGSADDVVELARAALDRAVSASEGRTVAARVVVRGVTRAHAALVAHSDQWEGQIRLAGRDVAGDELWVERVRFDTSPMVDRERLAARDDAIGQVVRALSALRDDPEGRAALLDVFADLRTKLPPEAREGLDAVRLDDPELVLDALRDVENMLLPELSSAGVDE
jgi:exonuclease SbcD